MCSQNVPFPYFAVDCQDLYIHHERNTVDAAAFGCAVCTILCVWNPTFLFLSFYAVIIGFSLNYAAYFAEIYRSGFQGIPVGQREAATLLGYGRRHTYFRILFPQMVKRVLPPVTNEVITLVKDTSLAYVVSFTEMFYIGQQLSAAQKSLLPLFVAGAFYYVFNFVIAFIMEKVEKKFNYYQ